LRINADDVDPMPEPDPDNEFWNQTAQLAHVHKFARSRGASPYATLGCVLRRVSGCIEPHVVLPPIVGGQVSLNLFTVPVGASGAGKDIANSAGHDACGFFQSLGSTVMPVKDASHIHPGTGEGLARVFKGRGEDQPGETRAHLQVPDVATLEALAGRKGQTLISQLLAAWMGQPIGFANNAKDTTTGIDAHSYRLCISIGVQPENAGFFLDREKDGLPQRFLWLPTNDPCAPKARPEPMNPENFELPHFDGDETERFVMQIPDNVAEEIWHHRWQVLSGVEEVDPLDAHIKLTQLKTAASIAILHNNTSVTDEAWKIAGQLIDVSATVRKELRAAAAGRARQVNAAKAYDQADREAIIRERLAEDAQRRVSNAITRKLKLAGTATKYDLRMACHSSIRADFHTVFDFFVDKGFIVCCENGCEGHADQYRVASEQG
jgi:hypothetical protein